MVEFFACTADPRFSFSLYIPSKHALDGARIPLLVAVHGIRRNVEGLVDHLKNFSEQHTIAVLCPLFPAGYSYNQLVSHDIRFDKVLFAMLDQAAGIWRIETERFFLHGFSAGGQFAHRFLYVHPTRLRGVSIGAPGSITRPSLKEMRWPKGVGNIEQVFGKSVDWEAVATVPVQVVVGERDTEMDMLSGSGGSRVERAQRLESELCDVGCLSVLTLVRNVGHNGLECISAVEDWLAPKIK
ncbi:poly hydrolase [Mycena amicta]|nr:poly hydrolase [Mycena amicta]